ncbi:CMP-N-acetylneuraminate-beta-galactosamide-alpha-2,3-sialyltransferase 1-like isoform X1 [Cyclopterus lumpus]|uniref:CMP-N-acetylneuraminate-beta-galactosamide-alpha-2,3-sialyltransferase 1 n=2 Tax=Cyclopterus lumpus TaxID=8103 RepID=A0A8C3APG9_CYCLU|nr:CMP-N-acetylneuraminate-beta-galactosamide-alpha-2,3-sialyltransferase 1-like isoform X1 [Cyclopterus lumpus]
MTWSCGLLPIHKRHTSKMNSKVGVLIFLLCVTGICVFWRGDVSSYFAPREERPWACSSEDEPLFMQRFSKFAEPFLSVNNNLSEDNFNWWKRLQAESRSFNAYKETVSKMFQMIPTSAEDEASSPDRCRSCAVVGNSVNLKKSHYGPLIDFQDVVIRMNRGPTKGYEADVGTRTTHHVMYPESAVNLENNTHLVLFAFKILDLEWVTKALSTGFSGSSYAPIASNIKANKDLVMVLDPAFMRYVHEEWLQKKGVYPSTGFMALVLALHICDEVHVFGYGADSDGNWSHYWEELRNKKLKTGGHPGDVEYAKIKELDQNQIIKFYRGG